MYDYNQYDDAAMSGSLKNRLLYQEFTKACGLSCISLLNLNLVI